MEFIWPGLLYGLLLVPLFVWLYLRTAKRRLAALQALGPLGQARDGAGRLPGRRRHIPPVFYLAGLTVLLFCLARPEMPVTLPHIEGTVILAFDVSSSMLADDLEPTRIEAARAAASAFVENQPETIRVGVVAFSNGGFVVQEPTGDTAAVLEAIDRLSPNGPTSLGQGIFTALNAIAGEPLAIDPEALGDPAALDDPAPAVDIGRFPSAVVLLLTDGENTSSPDPLVVAQVAADAGVRIYPVGIGSADGAVLEIDGYSILTQLNEPILEEIAALTNGAYYHAPDAETLQEIYETVDLQLTLRGEFVEVTSILAGIAAAFFLAGGFLSLAWFGRLP
jgi:Ca-activated chloride channel family protein